jgi:hypothetical protein
MNAPNDNSELTHPHCIVDESGCDAVTGPELERLIALGLVWQGDDGYWRMYDGVEWADIDRNR